MDWKNTALTTTRQINKGQIRGKIQVKVHFPGIIRMNAQNTNVSTTTVQQRYQQMMACRTTSVSWSNSDDSWQFFKDGALVRSGKYSRKGHTIKGGETLTIGQEQDSFAGDFDVDQSFQGSLTGVNLWSCVLRSETITKMSK